MIENANKNEEEVIDKITDGDAVQVVDGQNNIEEKKTSEISNQADGTEDEKNTSVKQENGNKVGFFSSLLSIAIDEVVVLGLSAAVLFISNFIMQFLGYYIAQKLDLLFILFLILNLIYTSVMETSKFSGTLGKLITNLKVFKL